MPKDSTSEYNWRSKLEKKVITLEVVMEEVVKGQLLPDIKECAKKLDALKTTLNDTLKDSTSKLHERVNEQTAELALVRADVNDAKEVTDKFKGFIWKLALVALLSAAAAGGVTAGASSLLGG